MEKINEYGQMEAKTQSYRNSLEGVLDDTMLKLTHLQTMTLGKSKEFVERTKSLERKLKRLISALEAVLTHH